MKRKGRRYNVNSKMQLNRDALGALYRKWRIRELLILGSALRDDFGPNSDVDFLVSFDPAAKWSLWDPVTMHDELAAIAGREIDLLKKEGLRNPYRRNGILSTREVILAS